jgi:hypothetical protein
MGNSVRQGMPSHCKKYVDRPLHTRKRWILMGREAAREGIRTEASAMRHASDLYGKQAGESD